MIKALDRSSPKKWMQRYFALILRFFFLLYRPKPDTEHLPFSLPVTHPLFSAQFLYRFQSNDDLSIAHSTWATPLPSFIPHRAQIGGLRADAEHLTLYTGEGWYTAGKGKLWDVGRTASLRLDYTYNSGASTLQSITNANFDHCTTTVYQLSQGTDTSFRHKNLLSVNHLHSNGIHVCSGGLSYIAFTVLFS